MSDSFDDCSNDIINAHSLQRMGALARIEYKVNGNNGVYALTEKELNPKTGLLELKPIGKKVASTFFGFCGNLKFTQDASGFFKDVSALPILSDASSFKISVIRYNMHLGGNIYIPFSN